MAEGRRGRKRATAGPIRCPRRKAIVAPVTDLQAVAKRWSLTLGEPYVQGAAGYTTRATTADGTSVVLKVFKPHREAEHEADALELWDGEGAVRLLRRISTIYGGRPGLLGFLRLARAAFSHLAVTGGVAILFGILLERRSRPSAAPPVE